MDLVPAAVFVANDRECVDLVQMHGGQVEHSSELVVRLPLAAAPSREVRRRRAAPVGASGQRVLVVDDNQDAADALGMLLGLMGADVPVVHDGAAALEAIAEHSAETVFLDIGMPGMDGYEVARRIRAQAGNGDVLLVAVTGWGQEEDRRRVKEAGFDHHLTKPVGVNDLNRVLSRRRPDPPEGG